MIEMAGILFVHMRKTPFGIIAPICFNNKNNNHRSKIIKGLI